MAKKAGIRYYVGLRADGQWETFYLNVAESAESQQEVRAGYRKVRGPFKGLVDAMAAAPKAGDGDEIDRGEAREERRTGWGVQ